MTLFTMCFPPEDHIQASELLAVGGHKTWRFCMRRSAFKIHWRPRYRQASSWEPLRPVVLRPHLSAGLPLNSWVYYAIGTGVL